MSDGSDGALGPAMLGLTEKQRGYVMAMAADPFGNPTRWAKAAGYRNSEGGYRVLAHHLSHDPRIEAAVREYARSALGTMGSLLAAAGLMRIARNTKHPKHFQALEALADRVGLPRTTEHNVRVAHTDLTGEAMAARIRELAGRLGVDPGKLLGANAAPEMRLIEGQAVPMEAKDG